MRDAGTSFVGALLEAWQELRIHKTRVLLSLIGVAVAVCALTTVVGLGTVAKQATVEVQERSSGRPASIYLSASMPDGSAVDPEVMQKTWSESVERYGVGYASRVLMGGTGLVQFVDGAVPVATQAVDEPYGAMHRFVLDQGEWFAPGDAERLAPAIIVNQLFWQRLGSPELSTHPTVSLLGEYPTTAVVTGVYTSPSWQQQPEMYMLADAYFAFVGPEAASQQSPQYEMWVPEAVAGELTGALERDFTAALGEGAQVYANRQDYAAYGGDPYLPLTLGVGGIAVLVLLLGALGLLNIALVTVKQRIREIGIRRSFGATAGRVFFAVMMESVVATIAAGAIGVMAAVLIVKNPWVEGLIGQGLVTEFPPFPADAALLGLGAATLVGALAGLMPALIAVRVKVIDAIRY